MKSNNSKSDVRINLSKLYKEVEELKKRKYIQDDVKVTKCPLNPPNKNFKHIVSSKGIKAQCYQCGQFMISPKPFGKNELLKSVLSLIKKYMEEKE